MATKFLEPGGDADFAVATTNGFWSAVTGSAAIATDFVHGAHIKSFSFGTNGQLQRNTIMADAGTRVSFYLYIETLPSATSTILTALTAANATVVPIRLTSTGVLQLWNATTAQIGSNGSTLSTGVWYRISYVYTITNTTTNEFRLFKDGVIDISITNATITNTTGVHMVTGNRSANATLSIRNSDIYVDDSSSLTDPGDIWVTAKRPFSNGSANNFTTQIGAGSSSYGSGHAPQVNERTLSITNGWSMVGAGAAVTEEYNIESKSTGDIDISTANIIDWVGWVSVKALAGTPTIQVILDGVNNAQAINTTATLYTKIKGSTTYPSGAGADIGIVTDTSLTTESLYECGVIVAYIPGVPLPPTTANDRTQFLNFMIPAQGR